jgi:hypothetical protein
VNAQRCFGHPTPAQFSFGLCTDITTVHMWASHCGGRDSSPGQSMWDLWWTKWHWGRFSLSTWVPLPILIPPTAPHSSSVSSGAGTVGQIGAQVPSGLSLTPSQETKKKKVQSPDKDWQHTQMPNGSKRQGSQVSHSQQLQTPPPSPREVGETQWKRRL